MSSVSSSHPTAVSGNLVGWSVDSETVEETILAAVPDIPPVLAGLMASYLPKQKGFFGESGWNELGVNVAPAPPLHPNIDKIWEGPCPGFPGKKVKETSVMFYLPTKVNGEPLTLETFGKILKQRYFPNSATGYKYIWDKIMEEIGNRPVGSATGWLDKFREKICRRPVGTPGWLILTIKNISGSNCKSYKTQQTMIQELSKKAGILYTMPTTLQAVVGFSMLTGEDLSGNTHTRCQEIIDGDYSPVVGGSSPEGLDVDGKLTEDVNEHIGVAVVRQL